MGADIGKQIKQIRQQQGLTLQELGEMANLSVGYISLVERGKTSISISSLENIAGALGVSSSELFRPAGATSKRVVRGYDPQVFRVQESQYVCHNLCGDVPVNVRAMEPLLIIVLPGQEREHVFSSSHEGEEFGYVLEGMLTCHLENTNYDLGPGDSLHIPSRIRHSWANHTNKLVKVLFVSTPKLFD